MEIKYSKAAGLNRTFSWCGQKWFCKNSQQEKVGPGPSYFDHENIEIGSDNSLRLWVRGNDIRSTACRKDCFSSAEIQTTVPLGYGIYQVDVYGCLTGPQWENLVFGFFTYDNDNPSQNNKEIDIEIGTFGGKHTSGGVFSNQNDEKGGRQLLDISPSTFSKIHCLTIKWLPDSVEWSLADIHNGRTINTLQSTTYVPSCEGALLHINLWQFKGIMPNGTAQCIVLRNFGHKHHPWPTIQLRYVDKVFFNDYSHTFVVGKTYNNKRILITASRHMTNVKVSVGSELKDVEVKYPGGQEKTSLNGDIEIKGGQTDFVTMTLKFLDDERDVLPINIECDQFRSCRNFSIPVKVKYT